MYRIFVSKLTCFPGVKRTVYSLNIKLCKYVSTSTSEEKFTPIYKFAYIRPASLINRMKAYQTFLTLVAVPSSLTLYNLNIITFESIIVTCTIGITGTLSLFLFGAFPYRLIGFLYVNQDCSTLKISYIDFWGRRKDNILPVNDITPLTDLPVRPTDLLYLTLRRYSCKEIYKINLKYGIVLDQNNFNNVFLQKV